jgi:acetyl esterase/lipase
MTKHTYRYGPEADHVGDLWLPEGDGPFPLLVVLHGGYWRAYYKRDLMDGLCADLVRRGWAAWNLEYRRLGAGGGWPATFRDVATGVDLLDLLAERHPLELQRFGALGHSAGGHLALWIASRRGLPAATPGAEPVVNPAFVVDLAGVSDLRLAEQLEQGSHAAAELLGGTPDERPGRYELASPTERIPIGVPTAVVHGTADTNVAPEISASYVAKAREAGDRVELISVPDADHFDLIDPDSGAWAQAADQLTRLVPAR